MIRKVTFWQNMPSHHMGPVQRELARLPGYQVRTIFTQDISDRRREMGWSMPDLAPAEVKFLDENVSTAKRLAEESYGINFFGGFPTGVLKEAFDNLPLKNGQTLSALILESGDTHDLRGKIRPLFHAMRIRQLRSRVDFLLAFGSLGVDYYAKCGFERARIFPFLYQTEDFERTLPSLTIHPVQIVYCGSFSKRKGVDLLLRALASLSHMDWNLEIVGDGPETPKLQKLAEHLNLSRRIIWRGFVPDSEITRILRQKDICVIPSRFDGWGMLTNEALSAGVAVVTTSRVGSKGLVEVSGAGCVATSPTSHALRKCLEHMLSSPEEIDKSKKAAARISCQLTGRSTALYLDAVIRCWLQRCEDRPEPPWVLSSQIESAEI